MVNIRDSVTTHGGDEPTRAAAQDRSHGYGPRTFLVDVLAANDGPLPISSLVEVARWFGFRDGTLRVCLSRMVRGGSLSITEQGGRSCYGFTTEAVRFNKRLRDRVWFDRRRSWSGAWRLVLLAKPPSRRDARERISAELKRLELRPIGRGVWARPDNVELTLESTLEACRRAGGRVDSFAATPDEAERLADRALRLWDVSRLASTMSRELEILDTSRRRVPKLERRAALVETLTVGAAAFRIVARDPLLPLEILPRDWPGERLREAVVEYNHLGCDVWATAPLGQPARNPRPRLARPRRRS